MAKVKFPAKKLQRLRKAAIESRKAMGQFRELRSEAIEQYMGRSAQGQTRNRVSRNLLEKFVTTYMGLLAGQLPSVRVDTHIRALKPEAFAKEQSLRQRGRDLNLSDTFQAGVLDAFFAMGIVRCGMSSLEPVREDDQEYDVGEPYVGNVSPGDYVVDMTARDFGEAQYEGHRFYADKESLEKHSDVPGEVMDRLRDAEQTQKKDNPQMLGSGSRVFSDPFRPMLELWDFYLPSEKLILTLDLYGSDDDEPIKITEYDGLDGGPYIKLWFHRIPDNILPLPPIASRVHLHRLVNALNSKLGDQAQRAKKIGVYQKANEVDAKSIKESGDGEVIGVVGGPQAVEERIFGGPDGNVFAYALRAEEWFNRDCGNLELLAGISAQSATATQDQLLAASASRLVQKMQERVMLFYRDVYRHIAYYDHYNQFYQPDLPVRIPGTSVEYKAPFTRNGKFPDYQFEIVPESFTFDPPSMKFQKLNMLVDQYLKLGPMAQMQGAALDVRATLERSARYLNNQSDLVDIITFAAPRSQVQENLEQSQDNPVRRTERISRSAQTQQGSDRVLEQSLMGANPQEKQMAALARAF